MSTAEALKMAIEALKEYQYADTDKAQRLCAEALEQCKSALAEIENSEPVAEQIMEIRLAINEVYEFERWLKENTLIRANLDTALDYADPLAEIAYKSWQARAKLKTLYTSPISKEWVSLSDDEIDNLYNGASWLEYARAIEAKLKDLNHE